MAQSLKDMCTQAQREANQQGKGMKGGTPGNGGNMSGMGSK